MNPPVEELACDRLNELGLPILNPDHPFERLVQNWTNKGGTLVVWRHGKTDFTIWMVRDGRLVEE